MSLLDSISGGNMANMGMLNQMQGGANNGLNTQDMDFLKSFSDADKIAQDMGNRVGDSQNVAASSASSTNLPRLGEDNAPSFGDMINGLVDYVDDKQKTSQDEVQKVMTGESDNLHQAMIAMQEASVSMDLLIEVRNKLVESYKELTSMQT
jgi:flagellar hook-basal body complex protein FliE